MKYAIQNTGFRFHYVDLTPDEQIGIHQQPTWELSYVIRGSGTRLIGSSVEQFGPGDMVLVPPTVPHCWTFDNSQKRISNLTLTFETSMLDNIAATFPDLENALMPLRVRTTAVRFTGRQSERLRHLMASLRHQEAHRRVPTFISILLSIAEYGKANQIEGASAVTTAELRMRKVDVYISCNSRRKFTIDDVARYVGMNRTAFCTFFKQMTGKSFVTALNEYRLAQVARQLTTTSLPITELAYTAGFQTIPHFNHIFRETYGMSPREFRRQTSTPCDCKTPAK